MRACIVRALSHVRSVSIALLLAGASSLTLAERVWASVPAPPHAAVTESDIAASNEKIRQAYGALAAMWSAEFKQAGGQFVPPALVRYRGIRADRVRRDAREQRAILSVAQRDLFS